jgi:sec-independent protein translocase protein TatA
MNVPVFAFVAPGPFEMLVLGGIVLLLFGSRLPGVMRSLGRSVVEFKKGVKGIDEVGEEESSKDSKKPSAESSTKQDSDKSE